MAYSQTAPARFRNASGGVNPIGAGSTGMVGGGGGAYPPEGPILRPLNNSMTISSNPDVDERHLQRPSTITRINAIPARGGNAFSFEQYRNGQQQGTPPNMDRNGNVDRNFVYVGKNGAYPAINKVPLVGSQQQQGGFNAPLSFNRAMPMMVPPPTMTVGSGGGGAPPNSSTNVNTVANNVGRSPRNPRSVAHGRRGQSNNKRKTKTRGKARTPKSSFALFGKPSKAAEVHTPDDNNSVANEEKVKDDDDVSTTVQPPNLMMSNPQRQHQQFQSTNNRNNHLYVDQGDGAYPFIRKVPLNQSPPVYPPALLPDTRFNMAPTHNTQQTQPQQQQQYNMSTKSSLMEPHNPAMPFTGFHLTFPGHAAHGHGAGGGFGEPQVRDGYPTIRVPVEKGQNQIPFSRHGTPRQTHPPHGRGGVRITTTPKRQHIPAPPNQEVLQQRVDGMSPEQRSGAEKSASTQQPPRDIEIPAKQKRMKKRIGQKPKPVNNPGRWGNACRSSRLNNWFSHGWEK